jgi:predicted transcriptional regulator
MEHRTTVWMTAEEWDALQSASKQLDRTQSYLMRKAVYAVYVLKLIDISAIHLFEAEADGVPA